MLKYAQKRKVGLMTRALWFRFILLALFFFAYQTTAIHSKHHLVKELNQCEVCHLSKHLDANSHETFFIVVSDILAVELETVEEKAIIKEAFDLTQKPQIKRLDLSGLKHLNPRKPILTYYALAPPLYFS